MNRFDRDLATLRDLLAQRQAKGLRYEDLDTEEERKACRIWRTFQVQSEMPGYTEDREPPTYETVLRWVRYGYDG